jgi:hypothetical protein
MTGGFGYASASGPLATGQFLKPVLGRRVNAPKKRIQAAERGQPFSSRRLSKQKWCGHCQRRRKSTKRSTWRVMDEKLAKGLARELFRKLKISTKAESSPRTPIVAELLRKYTEDGGVREWDVFEVASHFEKEMQKVCAATSLHLVRHPIRRKAIIATGFQSSIEGSEQFWMVGQSNTYVSACAPPVRVSANGRDGKLLVSWRDLNTLSVHSRSSGNPSPNIHVAPTAVGAPAPSSLRGRCRPLAALS